MKIISAAEARKRFAEITDEVRQGKTSYTIVRYGKEIARLMPPATTQDVDPLLESDIDDFFKEYGDVLVELAKR